MATRPSTGALPSASRRTHAATGASCSSAHSSSTGGVSGGVEAVEEVADAEGRHEGRAFHILVSFSNLGPFLSEVGSPKADARAELFTF